MVKINIAELLKDCPKGMELDCTMFDEVTLLEVTDSRFPIKIAIGDKRYRYLTETGGYANDIIPESKCVIFPKGKTTWEGFVPPCQFNDGDIVHVDCGGTYKYIAILKQIKDIVCVYGLYCSQYKFYIHENLCEASTAEIRLATEEEKEKLFQAIKDNGYKWNAETKTLEQLPMYKEGENDTYKQALLTFGCHSQRMMCMEECTELIDALAKYGRGRNDSADVITELADVSIMVEQMAEFFGREAYEVERERKMVRLQEHIETRKKK